MTTPVRPLVRAGCALTLVAAVLAGCGEQSTEEPSRGSEGRTPSSSQDPDGPDSPDGDTGTRASGVATRLGPDDPRPEVDCAGGQVSMRVLDYVRGARGAPTPEAVLQERARRGETFVMTEDGATAWILRADGTARERVTLTQRRGWLPATVEAC